MVYDWEALGEDPHAVHGTSASDGGYVAVGNSVEEDGAKAFIVKSKADCMNEGTYNELVDGGSGCSGWDWVT